MSVAKEQESVVQFEADLVNQQAHKIKIIYDEANKELEQVKPELDQALAAVENIDKQSIDVLKGFLHPPIGPRIVMEAVFILLGIKYTWEKVKIEL